MQNVSKQNCVIWGKFVPNISKMKTLTDLRGKERREGKENSRNFNLRLARAFYESTARLNFREVGLGRGRYQGSPHAGLISAKEAVPESEA